jgi:branched-subunit amino acid transport protein
MMDFLETYHLQGLVLGLCSFLIIGIFHPIVIKGEYHYGQRFKWVFLLGGLVMCTASILVKNVMLSALFGVAAFSCFWGIKEMADQQQRVRKGWFPRNPKRTYPWDDKTDN